MTEDLLHQVISSLREMREEVQELLRVQSKQAGQLELLIGNGQPGRITKVEDDIESLQAFRNQAKGAMAVSVFLWGGIEFIAHWIFRRG